MHHRYGRHGPHAWRRWRERHFNRYPPYFDNTAYTVVLYVQVPPVNIERIIIVMDYEDPRRSLEFVDDGGTMDSLPKESLDPLSDIGWLATNDAIRLADTDLNCHDPASGTDLEHIAGILAHRCLRRSDVMKMIRRSDATDGYNAFTVSFIEKYHEIIEGGEMSILSKEKEAIWARACIDKQKDQNVNYMPPPDLEITCRAAIQEHEQSGSDERSQPDYFQKIAKRVSTYLSFYKQPSLEKKVEWKERLDRAGIFLE